MFCIRPVPLALFDMLNEELKKGFSIMVINGKVPTRGTPKYV